MTIPFEKVVAEDLNLGNGSVTVTNPAGGTMSGTKINIGTFVGGTYNVVAYGADPTGATDSTAGITAAFTAAASGGTIVFPAGLYMITPTAVMTGTEYASIYYVGELKSNMTIRGEGDATIKIEDDWSSDLSPKNVGIFATNAAISDVKVLGLNFDGNKANNPVSTLVLPHAAVYAGGTNAGISNLTIRDCNFSNLAGSGVIINGHSSTNSSTLPKGMLVEGCSFIDAAGTETIADHSTVYCNCEDAVIHGNVFSRSTYAPKTKLAFELHGSRSVFSNNTVVNYSQGGWIADNLTSINYGSKVIGNTFVVNTVGVGLWNYDSGGAGNGDNIRDAEIAHNFIDFTNNSHTVPNGYKAGVWLGMYYSCNGVQIHDNIISGARCVVETVRGVYGYCGTAANTLDKVSIRNNRFYGMSHGVYMGSYGQLGDIGYLEICGNKFEDASGPGAVNAHGIFLDFITAQPLQKLVIKDNSFVDANSSMLYGVVLAGKFLSVYCDENYYSGMGTGNYAETVASDTSPSSVVYYSVLNTTGSLHVGGVTDPGDNNALIDGTLEVTGATTHTGLTKTVAGVHVGGTSDPGADNLLVDGTLEVTGITTHTGLVKTVGGVHVGGAADPGADNLIVDGTAEVTGAVMITGLTKTVGGVHVGGTSDPGADNLLVDGTMEVTGATTLTGLVKTVAGVHVGGTADPGADKLLVDSDITTEGVLYFGDASTDGSWRIYKDGNGNLLIQKRETGSWTTYMGLVV